MLMVRQINENRGRSPTFAITFCDWVFPLGGLSDLGFRVFNRLYFPKVVSRLCYCLSCFRRLMRIWTCVPGRHWPPSWILNFRLNRRFRSQEILKAHKSWDHRRKSVSVHRRRVWSQKAIRTIETHRGIARAIGHSREIQAIENLHHGIFESKSYI
jgi:hypothetical protein